MDQVENTREYWCSVLSRIATPVLTNLSARTLHRKMPVEARPGIESAERARFSHLEAFGRLLAGIAPWLASGDPSSQSFAMQACEGLDAVSDPASPDFCNWTVEAQPLVDAAFLAQGIIRAPAILWQPLSSRVKDNLIRALRSTRTIQAGRSNWLLFSAMVEAGLFVMGDSDWDRMRVDYAICQHEQWYKGDGVYGDGPNFHWDYYNAFVIQPMLVDLIRTFGATGGWRDTFGEKIMHRARRFAAVQERFIAPDGTFPPIGRSLAYRFGAMQGLAQMALLHELPKEISPAQVREGLTAVIRRTIGAPGTFDENGWLRLGFCGHQPAIAEKYISTGSLYLCSVGLLPLGLPADDVFWASPAQPWTSQLAWSGMDFPIDMAL